MSSWGLAGQFKCNTQAAQSCMEMLSCKLTSVHRSSGGPSCRIWLIIHGWVYLYHGIHLLTSACMTMTCMT